MFVPGCIQPPSWLARGFFDELFQGGSTMHRLGVEGLEVVNIDITARAYAWIVAALVMSVALFAFAWWDGGESNSPEPAAVVKVDFSKPGNLMTMYGADQLILDEFLGDWRFEKRNGMVVGRLLGESR